MTTAAYALAVDAVEWDEQALLNANGMSGFSDLIKRVSKAAASIQIPRGGCKGNCSPHGPNVWLTDDPHDEE